MKNTLWNKIMMTESTIVINHSLGCQAEGQRLNAIGIIKSFYEIQGLTKVKVLVIHSDDLCMKSPFNDTYRHFDMHEIQLLHKSLFNQIYTVTI